MVTNSKISCYWQRIDRCVGRMREAYGITVVVFDDERRRRFEAFMSVLCDVKNNTKGSCAMTTKSTARFSIW